jgi:hypothetical protein
MFHINTDDKEFGWWPPRENSGKVYVNSRRWASDHQVSKPTYDQAEHFLRFIDKYVSCAVGNHYFLQWSKSNRTKTFLDKVTALDIAYTILVYEYTKEVWEEDLQIKVSSKDDMDRRHAIRHKKTKHHEGRGKPLKKFCNGWTYDGQDYYQELLGIFQDLKSSNVWETLQEYW